MTGKFNEIKRLPMLRLLIPFVAGIIVQYNARVELVYIFISCLILFFLLFGGLVIRPVNLSGSRFYGLIICLFVFAASMGLTENRMQASSFMDIHTGNSIVLSRIIDNPAERDRSYRLLIEPVAAIAGDTIIKTSKRAIAWIEKDSSSSTLSAGDFIAMPGNFREIQNRGNPWEFDYRRYSKVQGIYGEIYLPGDSWFIPVHVKPGSGIRFFPVKLRNNLLDILAESGITGRELSVASALLLGYRGSLDNETRQIYAGSGAMHILAVSGLHVGILYLLLIWMFGLFKNFRYYKIVSPALVIAIIWLYAAITGLSPSVTRSATMFSFLTIGRSLGKPAGTLNTLASAAIVQLLADPFSLFMVGFQLSYLAVAGIVLYQPAIYSLLRFNSYLPDRIWALVSLSFSAQLLIFPLIIYYFNHFPGYFLVTNIFAIPLAMMILYSGIFMFLFSFIGPVAGIFAFILNISLSILNSILASITSFPFSSIADIYVSPALVGVFYGLVLFLTLFFMRKKVSYLFFVIMIVIGGLALRADYRIKSAGQNVFIVYNAGGTSLYNFISGNENIIISSNPIQSDNGTLPQIIAGTARNLNAGNVSTFLMDEFFNDQSLPIPCLVPAGGNFIVFAMQTIYFPGEEVRWSGTYSKPVDVDLLVISSKTASDILTISERVNPSLVIIDSSVPYRQREKFIEQCRHANLPFHDVGTSGAYIARIGS